jgi:hypothetical protein
MAVANSPRTGSGGTFADKVTQPSQEEEEAPEQDNSESDNTPTPTVSKPAPVYARNKSTGKRLMSLDGGGTWQSAE